MSLLRAAKDPDKEFAVIQGSKAYRTNWLIQYFKVIKISEDFL